MRKKSFLLSVRGGDKTADNFDPRAYYDLICYMPAEIRQKVLDPEFENQGEEPANRFADFWISWAAEPGWMLSIMRI